MFFQNITNFEFLSHVKIDFYVNQKNLKKIYFLVLIHRNKENMWKQWKTQFFLFVRLLQQKSTYLGFGGKMRDNKLLAFWRFLTQQNIFPSLKNENLILIGLITYFIQFLHFATKIKKFIPVKNHQFFVVIQKWFYLNFFYKFFIL